MRAMVPMSPAPYPQVVPVEMSDIPIQVAAVAVVMIAFCLRQVRRKASSDGQQTNGQSGTADAHDQLLKENVKQPDRRATRLVSQCNARGPRDRLSHRSSADGRIGAAAGTASACPFEHVCNAQTPLPQSVTTLSQSKSIGKTMQARGSVCDGCVRQFVQIRSEHCR